MKAMGTQKPERLKVAAYCAELEAAFCVSVIDPGA